MPIKRTKLHVNDPPWISPEFKKIIKLRQKAFISGDSALFKHYRNLVNRERKTCCSKFFTAKVHQLKHTKPRQWWNAVEWIAGMSPASGPEDLFSLLHIPGTENLSPTAIANLINNSFLEPMESFRSLDTLPPFEVDTEVPSSICDDEPQSQQSQWP